MVDGQSIENSPAPMKDSTFTPAKGGDFETVNVTPGIDIRARLFQNASLVCPTLVTPRTLTMSSKFERATPLSSLTFAPPEIPGGKKMFCSRHRI